MTAPTIDLTEVQIGTALRSFLLSILPSLQVLKTQVNMVTPPPEGTDFIYWTPLGSNRLATNVETWDVTTQTPTVLNHTDSEQLDVQLDIYGPNAGDNCRLIKALFRSGYAYDYFQGLDLPLTPLYGDEGVQMPMINGEQQYENRWKLTVSFEGDFTISTTQQFADTLSVGLIDVDSTYPP